MKMKVFGPRRAGQVIRDALHDEDSGLAVPLAEHIRALVAAGRGDNAVELVVRRTGMTAAEAERFVQALDRG
jgi:hypothetical protein